MGRKRIRTAGSRSSGRRAGMVVRALSGTVFSAGYYEAAGGMEEENFQSLLQAEGEQVIVKSRLLEWLEQYSDTK